MRFKRFCHDNQLVIIIVGFVITTLIDLISQFIIKSFVYKLSAIAGALMLYILINCVISINAINYTKPSKCKNEEVKEENNKRDKYDNDLKNYKRQATMKLFEYVKIARENNIYNLSVYNRYVDSIKGIASSYEYEYIIKKLNQDIIHAMAEGSRNKENIDIIMNKLNTFKNYCLMNGVWDSIYNNFYNNVCYDIHYQELNKSAIDYYIRKIDGMYDRAVQDYELKKYWQKVHDDMDEARSNFYRNRQTNKQYNTYGFEGDWGHNHNNDNSTNSSSQQYNSRLEELLVILELDKNVRDGDIVHKQYKKLMMQCHPDYNKSEEAQEKSRQVNAAYQEIKDILHIK